MGTMLQISLFDVFQIPGGGGGRAKPLEPLGHASGIIIVSGMFEL